MPQLPVAALPESAAAGRSAPALPVLESLPLSASERARQREAFLAFSNPYLPTPTVI